MKTTLSFLAVCLLLATSPVRAITVAEFTPGPSTTNPGVIFGQSFTTVSSGPTNNIAFNFFSNFPATTPTAGGTAFLLSAQYLGMPAGLSAATPGFIGQAVASGGFYTFAASIILQPDTQYFLYTNASFLMTGGAPYAGGHLYAANGSGVNFDGTPTNSLNFRVTGTSLASTVPESGPTLGLLFIGLLGLTGARRLLVRDLGSDLVAG